MIAVQNSSPVPEPTIRDIEQIVQNGLEALRNAPLNDRITDALKFLTPPGYRPVAQLEEDGRKKRSTAAASNWNPETGEIVIYFERTDAAPAEVSVLRFSGASHSSASHSVNEPQSGVTSSGFLTVERVQRMASGDAQGADSQEVTPLQIQQCCETLAEAEKAGKAFIALKWFRDNALTGPGYMWADSLAYRQAVVTKAIELGAILTSSIPNPKAPQHPTTTVKLNRESKYAQAVAPRFQPIRPRGGELASEILLRDRGRF